MFSQGGGSGVRRGSLLDDSNKTLSNMLTTAKQKAADSGSDNEEWD